MKEKEKVLPYILVHAQPMYRGTRWSFMESGLGAGVLAMESGSDIPGECQLFNLHVDERYRRCNIGYALIQKAIEVAKFNNFDRVSLGVEMENYGTWLTDWYERMGFKDCGTATLDEFDNPHEGRYMVLELNDNNK